MKNKQNVPQVRFKGFTDAWEQRELSGLITEYKETVDSDCDLPVLTSSKTEGVVLQEEHFGRKQQHDITGYNILPRGYCTYRNRSDGVDFTFNINKCCDKGIISKFYPVFYGNNSDVFFISLVLNHSEEVVHEIGYTCTGTGQKVLSFLDLQKMNITVPSYDEQKKIASYFEHLDHLITLHQRKCETLQKLKKSMLQKMFPKSGSSYPEIRFAGFTDAWEQRELGKVFTIRNEKNGDRYTREDVLAVSDTYGCVNQIKFHGRSFAGEDISNYKVVRTGDIIYTKSPLQAKPYGIIKIVGEETGIISPLYVVNETVPGFDPMFMYYLFDTPERTNNYLNPLVRKGAKNTMNISNDEWLSGIVTISINEQEQKLIGNFLKSLDHLITLHQRKLETLKKLKKSMLRKMFI